MMRNDPMDDKLTLYRQQVLNLFYVFNFFLSILSLVNWVMWALTHSYKKDLSFLFRENQCIDVLDYFTTSPYCGIKALFLSMESRSFGKSLDVKKNPSGLSLLR